MRGTISYSVHKLDYSVRFSARATMAITVFPDSAIPACTSTTGSGFYCPAAVQTLTATFQSTTMITKAVTFNIANADTLLKNNPAYVAFNDLGGTVPAALSGSFDWGLPFFYGRNVFVAIEGRSTAAGPGPFVAF